MIEIDLPEPQLITESELSISLSRLVSARLSRYENPFNGMTPVGSRPAHGVSGGLLSNGLTAWHNSQILHTITARCSDLALAYCNWYDGETTTDISAITVGGSFNLGNDIVIPVTFNGRHTVTIDPGGTVVSDPIGIAFDKGSSVFVRSFVAPTTKFPYMLTTRSSSGEGVQEGTGSLVDLTESVASFPVNSQKCYAPLAVVAMRTDPDLVSVVGLGGDSLMNGLRDTPPDTGFGMRALNDQFSVVRFDRGGSTAARFAKPEGTRGSRFRAPLMNACTVFLSQFGINDLNSGATVDDLKDVYVNKLWDMCIRRGLPVFQTTLTPWTSSTDGWASLENQTLMSWEPRRFEINEWLRTIPAPLSGIVETADTLESARNSGKWKVNGTPNWLTDDGIHPLAEGNIRMAAAIDTDLFELAVA